MSTELLNRRIENEKQLLDLNLQHFANEGPAFNPDNVTMQSAKTGSIPKINLLILSHQ